MGHRVSVPERWCDSKSQDVEGAPQLHRRAFQR